MSAPVIEDKRGRCEVIETAIDINRSPEEVFDYASDHSREPEWNPRMRHVRKLTDGPMGLGTRYEMEFVPGRPMVAECVQFERPRAWKMAGRTLGIKVGLGGQVSPTPGGAHLMLQTEFRAGGLLGLLLPLMRRRMGPELERDIGTIKAILDG